MIELPESYVLAKQIQDTLVGKTITTVIANAHPHVWAWFTGDPALYQEKLFGRKITSSNPGSGYTCGGNTEVICEDMLLVFSTPIKYHAPGAKLPAKHQLLIEFDDYSHMSASVQMWGSMYCFSPTEKSELDRYANGKLPSPLTDAFDEDYFNSLFHDKDSISVKALLATEQRIPGFGNGVLQDILFRAKIHPKRMISSLSSDEKHALFSSLKETLHNMAIQGGRDTEKDLFGKNGGYQTLLSRKTIQNPCPVCAGTLLRQAYLGGNIYTCPACQPL